MPTCVLLIGPTYDRDFQRALPHTLRGGTLGYLTGYQSTDVTTHGASTESELNGRGEHGFQTLEVGAPPSNSLGSRAFRLSPPSLPFEVVSSSPPPWLGRPAKPARP
eukprot:4533852-Pyramimonas_sp.AAC.1